MSLTVGISGPTTHLGQQVQLLKLAGLDTHDQSNGSHGHPQVKGESWLTVFSDDLTKVEAVLAPLWQIRCHWNTPTCSVCKGNNVVSGPGKGFPCPECQGSGFANRKPKPTKQLLEVN